MDIGKELDKAGHLISIGRYKEAKKIVVELLSTDQYSYLFQLLATCELGMGNDASALRAVQQCLALDAGNDYGYFLLSLLEARKQSWSASEKALLRALELEPNHVPYLIRLAHIQLIKHDNGGVSKTIERGLTLDPNNVELLRMKASQQFAQLEDVEATATVMDALREDPTNPSLLVTLGYRQLDLKQYKEAHEIFTNALSHDPNNEEARQGLAETYKVRWRLFRLFYRYGFSRWKMEWSFWKVILWIFLIKTMIIWGVGFIGFLLFTWWGDVLFNSALRLGKQTKYLLSEQKIKQSNFFLAANLVALATAIAANITQFEFLWKITTVNLLAVFLGIAFLEVNLKRQRRSLGIAAGVIFISLIAASSASLGIFCMLASALLIIFGLLFSFRIIGW